MKMMKRSLFMVVGLLIITGLIAVHAKELQKVSCSETLRTFGFVPLYVADGKGFFEKNGLKVEIISAPGPLAMQVLVLGQVQFCAAGHGMVANLFLKGKKVKIVNQMRDKSSCALVGRPEISRITDLKGKLIGCSQIGTEPYAVGRYLAAKAGMNPEKDITMVGVGDMASMEKALENNRIQAAVTTEPLTSKLLLEKKGVLLARLNTRKDSLKYFNSPSYSFSILTVEDEYIKKNSLTVQKFVNAMVAAEKWILAHSVNELADVLVPYFPGMSKEIIKTSLETDKETWSRDGIVTKQAHDTAIKVSMDAGMIEQNVAFEDIVDNSFSQRALKVSKKR
jgi:NitT/TauT family transport system substrate-binding protein